MDFNGKKGDLKNSLIGILAFSGIIAVFVLGIFLWNYYGSSGFALGFGAEIEGIKISEDGNSIYVRIKGGSVDKKIESVKFVLTDVEGNKYFFETFEGLVELEVPYRKSFFGGIFGREELEGFFDYEIFVREIEGLGSFENLRDISVIFNYVDGDEKKKSSNILSVKVIPSGDEDGEGSVGEGSVGGGTRRGGGSGNRGSNDDNDIDDGGEDDGDGDEEIIPTCISNVLIEETCLCHSEEKSSGYCCLAQWQEGICEVFEADYYVDWKIEGGCDDYNVSTRSCGDGDETAFNTIQEGVDVLKPGDILAVRQGVYRESVILKNGLTSGTPNNKITIRNYPGEKPIIENTGLIEGWKKCSSKDECLGNDNWDKIYYSTLNEEGLGAFSNFFQGENFIYFSQDPNPPDRDNYRNINSFYRVDPSKVSENYVIDERLENLGGEELIGAYIALWVNPNAIAYLKILDFISSEDKMIFENLTEKNPGQNIYTDKKTRYSIINSYTDAIFDSQGEYYFNENNKKIYYWPFEELEDHQVTYSRFGRLFNININHNLVIDGFSFQKGSYQFLFSGWETTYNNTIRNCEFALGSAGASTVNQLYINSGINYVIEGNYLHNNRGNFRGIVVSGRGNVVKNNYLYKQEGTRIYFGGCKNCAMINNTVNKSMGTHGNALTVYQGSENILIAGNKVFDSNNGITIQASENVTIYNNLFYINNLGGYIIADWNYNKGYINILNNIALGSSNSAAIHCCSSDENLIKNNILDYGGDRFAEDNLCVTNINLEKIFSSSPKFQTSKVVSILDLQNITLDSDQRYYPNYESFVEIGDYVVFNEDYENPRILIEAEFGLFTSNWRRDTRISFYPPLEEFIDLETKGLRVEVWDKDSKDYLIDLNHKKDGLGVNSGKDISDVIIQLQEKYPFYDFYKDIEGNQRPKDEWDMGPFEFQDKNYLFIQCNNGIQDLNEGGIDCGEICEWECPTNYKSGISVYFNGTPGVDYAEEYFWYDKITDDTKVVYIKSDTPIWMEHNERNEMQTKEGNHITIGADGGGQIRYKLDRDWQLGRYYWAESKGGEGNRYPTYEGSFSLDDLTYGTGYVDDNSDVAVVGKTGHNGAGINTDSETHQISITDRYNHYQYGQLDEFGDEWHQMAIADDDTDIRKNAGYTFNENHASDSKLMFFVVNPKTPLISFKTTTSEAQFYTTPAKIYQVPKIHKQITYLTDDVEIKLVNIMNKDKIYYRLNGGVWQEYSNAFSSNAFSDGENILEYYYNTDFIKNRTIVKNPDYPSKNENNGYLLWENDEKWEHIKHLIKEDETSNQYYTYNRPDNTGASMRRRADFPENFDENKGQGLRTKWTKILHNAYIGKVEGFGDTSWFNSQEKLSAYACSVRSKEMLLDNVFNIANLGQIIGNGQPNPSIVLWRRGYYDVGVYLGGIAAYDILINEFKSTDIEGGITPIEDYKIRDNFASMSHLAMGGLGEYSVYSYTTGTSGMWDTAREITAYVNAIAMPSYSTPYYGTSGFDGAQANLWAPYPNQAITWKEAFHLEAKSNGDNLDFIGFPNMAHEPGINRMFLTEPATRPNDGRLLPVGSWHDRIPYASHSLQGWLFPLISNVVRISPYTQGRTFPAMDEHFELGLKGELYGLKVNSDGDLNPLMLTQTGLVNERFPDFAEMAEGLIEYPELLSGYNLAFYNPYWKDYNAENQIPITGKIISQQKKFNIIEWLKNLFLR